MTTPSPICFLDTETTGLDPDVHHIWECAAIRVDVTPEGEVVEERLWQLHVPTLGTADAIALNIGRYFERRAKHRDYRNDDGDMVVLRGASEFAQEFMEFTWGCHLAGAVISFDEERLRRLLRANGACPGWHYHIVDIEALAVGYLAGTSGGVVRPPWKSRDLSMQLGVDPDDFDAHTALGDARWAKAIYDTIMLFG